MAHTAGLIRPFVYTRHYAKRFTNVASFNPHSLMRFILILEYHCREYVFAFILSHVTVPHVGGIAGVTLACVTNIRLDSGPCFPSPCDLMSPHCWQQGPSCHCNHRFSFRNIVHRQCFQTTFSLPWSQKQVILHQVVFFLTEVRISLSPFLSSLLISNISAVI